MILPQGVYTFTLFGANGGLKNLNLETTTEEENSFNAGGIVSAQIALQSTTKLFVTLGGKGTHNVRYNSNTERDLGGYNKGGSAYYSMHGVSTGGGSSDIRYELNDVFHRILVAGAGGGSDDTSDSFEAQKQNDGRGGAGGGEIAQGFFIGNKLISMHVASKTEGFTFGRGKVPNIQRVKMTMVIKVNHLIIMIIVDQEVDGLEVLLLTTLMVGVVEVLPLL